MDYRPPPALHMSLCGGAPSDWQWGATDGDAAAAVVAAARACYGDSSAGAR